MHEVKQVLPQWTKLMQLMSYIIYRISNSKANCNYIFAVYIYILNGLKEINMKEKWVRN